MEDNLTSHSGPVEEVCNTKVSSLNVSLGKLKVTEDELDPVESAASVVPDAQMEDNLTSHNLGGSGDMVENVASVISGTQQEDNLTNPEIGGSGDKVNEDDSSLEIPSNYSVLDEILDIKGSSNDPGAITDAKISPKSPSKIVLDSGVDHVASQRTLSAMKDESEGLLKINKKEPDSPNTGGEGKPLSNSAILLGKNAPEDILTQRACLYSMNTKRPRPGSPGDEDHRPRKLSVNEAMMSPEWTQSAARRNSWSYSTKRSTTGRKKVRALRRDLTNQKLITQLFKRKEDEAISLPDRDEK